MLNRIEFIFNDQISQNNEKIAFFFVFQNKILFTRFEYESPPQSLLSKCPFIFQFCIICFRCIQFLFENLFFFTFYVFLAVCLTSEKMNFRKFDFFVICFKPVLFCLFSQQAAWFFIFLLIYSHNLEYFHFIIFSFFRIGEDGHTFAEKHAPNPIITVTQHTPNPSPDYLRRKVIS